MQSTGEKKKVSTQFIRAASRKSGLADPGPIASMFWLDDGLGSDLYLDGIVTLVDAKHIRQVRNMVSARVEKVELM